MSVPRDVISRPLLSHFKFKDTDLMATIEFNLEEEAIVIEPILAHCYHRYQNHGMSASDMAGIFILSYLGLRRRKAWSNGRLKSLVSTSLNLDSTSTECSPFSVAISSVPGLLDILDRGYVAKRMNKKGDSLNDDQDFHGVTVLSIFNTLQLRGIKKNADDYVNRCLVGWAYGLRPCNLMFRIPIQLDTD